MKGYLLINRVLSNRKGATSHYKETVYHTKIYLYKKYMCNSKQRKIRLWLTKLMTL